MRILKINVFFVYLYSYIMNEKDINKITDSLKDGLSFVKDMIHNFDSGQISKLYPYLTEEERKRIIEKRIEIKKASEDLSKVLSNGGIYDIDSKEIAEIKKRIEKIKE